MRKHIFVLWLNCLLLFSLTPYNPRPVRADGAFFSNREHHLYEPEQKAIVMWDGTTESMLISSRVKARDVEDLSRVVWLIPIQSSNEPEVQSGDIGVFTTFVDYFAPEREYGAIGATGSGGFVVQEKEIDIYDIAVLKVTSAEDLVSWMNDNGYAFPEAAVTAIGDYLKDGESYFVANRIDPSNRPEIKPKDLVRDLSRGLATPLRIDFRPLKPVYPLRISNLHKGRSRIEVYVCSHHAVLDAGGTMRVDQVKVLPHRIIKQAAPNIDLRKATHVTRLTYEGDLSALSADAVFQPAPQEIAGARSMTADDEQAFEDIFLEASVKDGHYVPDDRFLTRLGAFMESRPGSRFADDAVFLLVMSAMWYGRERASLSLSAEQLEKYLEIIGDRAVQLETFTEVEMGADLKSMIRHYTELGVLKAYLMLQVAEYYRYVEDNREGSGRLAVQISPALDRLPEMEAQRLRLLLPDHQMFEKYFDEAVVAYAEKDWAAAARLLEEAVVHEPAYRPCNIAMHCAKNSPAAYYLLGISRINLKQWAGAREAFGHMLKIAPDYSDGMLVIRDGAYASVSSDRARSLIVSTYLEEGSIDQGLEAGITLLRQLQEGKRLSQTGKMIAHANYNLACAYALKGNSAEALVHLRESLFEDPNLAAYIVQDTDLSSLHGTEAFRKLPAQVEETRQRIKSIGNITSAATLIKLLGDGSPRVRSSAVQALGRIRDVDAVEPLIEALGDRYQEVRLRAAETLSRTADPRTFKAFVALVGDRNHGVRLHAVEALGRIKNPQAVGPLNRALSDESWQVRRSTVVALGRIGDPSGVEPLLAALDDDDRAVKAAAIQSLGKIKDVRAAKFLIEKFKDSEVKRDAAIVLWRMPRDDQSRDVLRAQLLDPEVFTALVEAINDNDDTVRRTVVWALGITGDGRAVEPLIRVLEDEEQRVRLSAVRALGTTGDPRAADALIGTLKSKEHFIRQQSASALGAIKDPRAIGPLTAALQDKDERVGRAAAQALKEIKGEKVNDSLKGANAIPRSASVPELGRTNDPGLEATLLAALKDNDARVRESAVKALGQKKDPATVPLLMEALRDSHIKVRDSAARALGAMKDPGSVDLLIAALKDKDPTHRSMAAYTLGFIVAPRAAGPLVVALRDEDKRVRNRAAYALGLIKDPSSVKVLLGLLKDRSHPHREAVANALGKTRASRAVEPLLEALGDDDRLVRAAAAGGLGWINDVRFVDPLIEALRDDDQEVRESAAWSLQQIRDPRSIEALIGALQDESRLVRSYAVFGLGVLGKDERSVAALKVVLKGEDADVRRRAESALKRWGIEVETP